MKALVEYIKEGKTVNEKKIASIQDEIAFWNNPKTEKELIKITGLNKDFVHDAVMYIAGAVEDTLKDGYSDDWSIDGTIDYFTNDEFVENFTNEYRIYKKWDNGDIDFNAAAKEFADAALSLISKQW